MWQTLEPATCIQSQSTAGKRRNATISLEICYLRFSIFDIQQFLDGLFGHILDSVPALLRDKESLPVSSSSILDSLMAFLCVNLKSTGMKNELNC